MHFRESTKRTIFPQSHILCRRRTAQIHSALGSSISRTARAACCFLRCHGEKPAKTRHLIEHRREGRRGPRKKPPPSCELIIPRGVRPCFSVAFRGVMYCAFFWATAAPKCAGEKVLLSNYRTKNRTDHVSALSLFRFCRVL